jgi:hypothetical protein
MTWVTYNTVHTLSYRHFMCNVSKSFVQTLTELHLNLFSFHELWAGWSDLIPVRDKKFSLLSGVQTGSQAHPASYLFDSVGSFLGVKRRGA